VDRPLDPESRKLTIDQGYQLPTLVVRKGLRTVFMTTEVHYKENLITMNLIIIFIILKFCPLELESTTLETQGLLVGTVREILSGESLFEGQKCPWELTLTEPVPEIFEFVPLIGQKNIFRLKISHCPN